jgi:hypothetical protein
VYLNNMRSTATLYKHAYVTESYWFFILLFDF